MKMASNRERSTRSRRPWLLNVLLPLARATSALKPARLIAKAHGRELSRSRSASSKASVHTGSRPSSYARDGAGGAGHIEISNLTRMSGAGSDPGGTRVRHLSGCEWPHALTPAISFGKWPTIRVTSAATLNQDACNTP
jgi:hypothetical protein